MVFGLSSKNKCYKVTPIVIDLANQYDYKALTQLQFIIVRFTKNRRNNKLYYNHYWVK